MNSILTILLLLILCLVVSVVISTIMTKRSMHQIIRALKRNGAVNSKNAKAMDELGLNPKSFTERVMKFRDYNPKTLEFLVKLNIVICRNDGLIYLSEKNLLSSKLAERWPSIIKEIKSK